MTSLLLKKIPVDVQKIINAKQKDEKEKCDNCNFSKDRAIYKIIREWKAGAGS